LNLNLYTHIVDNSCKYNVEEDIEADSSKLKSLDWRVKESRDAIMDHLKFGNFPEDKDGIAKMFD
jgi:hypothetical protein